MASKPAKKIKLEKGQITLCFDKQKSSPNNGKLVNIVMFCNLFSGRKFGYSSEIIGKH